MAAPQKEINPTTGKPRWRIQFKNLDGKRSTKRFATKREANSFLRSLNEEIDRKARQSEAHGVALNDAIQRYMKTELTKLKDDKWTRHACERFSYYEITTIYLNDLTIRDAQKHIMFREQSVGPSTIIREFTVLKSILRLCEKWYGLEYPWTGLKLDPPPEARDRLITDEEEATLAAAVNLDLSDPDTEIRTANERAIAAFLFCCDTALRRGEAANLTFSMLDMEAGVIHLPAWAAKGKKNSRVARDAFITARARQILSKLAYRAGNPRDKVFDLDSDTMGTLFRRVRNKALPKEQCDFTFHDSRHKAITRLAHVSDMTVVELAKAVGHKDLNQLMTYFEPTAAATVKKVDAHEAASEGSRSVDNWLKATGMTPEQAIAELTSRS